MSPRRLIPRLLLCLTLGLATTIAIAWTSAAFAPLTPSDFRQSWVIAYESDTPLAAILTAARRGMARSYLNNALGAWSLQGDQPDEARANVRAAEIIVANLRADSAFPPRWGRMPDPAEIHRLPLGDVQWLQDARGWPMLALWCEWIGRGPPARPSPPLGGLPLQPTTRVFRLARALPYRPIPLGLLADTLIFALAWSALLAAPRLIRTRYRRRRNLCPRCAYNLAGLPPNSPCPECGPAPRYPSP